MPNYPKYGRKTSKNKYKKEMKARESNSNGNTFLNPNEIRYQRTFFNWDSLFIINLKKTFLILFHIELLEYRYLKNDEDLF